MKVGEIRFEEPRATRVHRSRPILGKAVGIVRRVGLASLATAILLLAIARLAGVPMRWTALALILTLVPWLAAGALLLAALLALAPQRWSLATHGVRAFGFRLLGRVSWTHVRSWQLRPVNGLPGHTVLVVNWLMGPVGLFADTWEIYLPRHIDLSGIKKLIEENAGEPPNFALQLTSGDSARGAARSMTRRSSTRQEQLAAAMFIASGPGWIAGSWVGAMYTIAGIATHSRIDHRLAIAYVLVALGCGVSCPLALVTTECRLIMNGLQLTTGDVLRGTWLFLVLTTAIGLASILAMGFHGLYMAVLPFAVFAGAWLTAWRVPPFGRRRTRQMSEPVQAEPIEPE